MFKFCANSNEDVSYQLIRLIEENPIVSQRQLALKLGISLGKVNFYIKMLKSVGWITSVSCKNEDKVRTAYTLTMRGRKGKKGLALRSLQSKKTYLNQLLKEICDLQEEIFRM
jgi:predicted transcriptional regulator